MRTVLLVLLGGAVTFGVPLIIALREMIVTGSGGGWHPDRPREPERPQKPLPPCLIPANFPRHVPDADAPDTRVLETV